MITNAGELSKYAAAWLTCSRCGLTSPRVAGEPPLCGVKSDCRVGQRGFPINFGGPDWSGRPPAIPQLDADDHAAIANVSAVNSIRRADLVTRVDAKNGAHKP